MNRRCAFSLLLSFLAVAIVLASLILWAGHRDDHHAAAPRSGSAAEKFFRRVPAMEERGPLEGAIPALYVFGDSLVDAGNNNFLNTPAKADRPPYGIDFHGNPNGRFTNGRTHADFLAQLAGLPFPPPYEGLSEAEKKNTTTGMNFGSASCGILPKTGGNIGSCLFLERQIELFEFTAEEGLQGKFKGPQQVKAHLANALFLINMGSNDYMINYMESPQLQALFDPTAFARHLSDRLVNRIERLHKIGARKFMVANIGPLGCALKFYKTKKQCDAQVNAMVSEYNSLLSAKLSRLQSTHQGFTFSLFNTYNFSMNALKNSQQFGIPNPWIPCFTSEEPGVVCEDRDKYLSFDGAHPTQTIHFNVIKSCFLDPSICTPLTLSQLLLPPPP